jgi:hypothetical protein
MKNNLVRLFVLSLTVAGFGAASVAAHARTTTKAQVAPLGTIGSQPLCGPNDPNGCGMD